AKRYYFLRASTFFLGFGIAVSISGADLVLQKVPPLTVAQAPNYPQNLARFDLGAQIESDVPDDASSDRKSTRLNSSHVASSYATHFHTLSYTTLFRSRRSGTIFYALQPFFLASELPSQSAALTWCCKKFRP